jgi:outer membrane lipoprotein carrier protein
MKTMFRLAALAAALLVSATAAAGGRERMQAFTAGLKGLEGRFEQRVFDPNGRQTEHSNGTLELSAPRLFRWETLKPYPQLIVADGDHIWIHDPELEQVTVRNQSFEEQGSPLTVLIDPTELERQFVVKPLADDAGLQWLQLTPRKAEGAPFDKAKLGFGVGGLVKMELFDALGQRTVMLFSGWQRNPRFAAGRFTFTPPKGADVIGEVSKGAEVTPLVE